MRCCLRSRWHGSWMWPRPSARWPGGGGRRGCGVRPAAQRAGVPYTTARGWVRRFRARAAELGVAFAAVAVELDGQAVTPPAGAGRFALTAIGAAFAAAASLPGWGRLGAWRFASAVTGGRLIAASTVSPWYVVGRRRLKPPIPP